LTLITPEARALIGMWSAVEPACDPVEQGAVRRFAQAIMDDDPAFRPDADAASRFGGPIAPLLFPNHMLRRPFGTPDVVQ
jgi:hypothetical protein